MRKLILIPAVLILLLSMEKAFSVELTTELVAQGFKDPLFLISPRGDTERLFILEQNSGQIKIIKNGEVLETPFLDIGRLASQGGERGLLGLAFHPNYSENGYFFINYTDNRGDTVISRYKVSDDPDVADPESASVIMKADQPYSNHNGGMIAFGPDGYLYIGHGDGGSANDPKNISQDTKRELGKILRIDVDGGEPYSIPEDNPFVNDPEVLDSIWALGLRNPWRFSFDSKTGDMYIADVGQNKIEEISFQPAASKGGENYGWRCMEGTRCTGLDGCVCNSPELMGPIHEYTHSGGNCSVTGGYVYRGSAIPKLDGTYFFADFCSGNIWSFKWDGEKITEFKERKEELKPDQKGKSIRYITSFGQDADGELYILDKDGDIFKIVAR